MEKSVKALHVNGKVATDASVRDGSWPIARPLFLYSNSNPKGAAGKFVDFLLSKQGQDIVKEVKYVSLK
jgi:phosphate transport system substrate-binding protein